MSIVKTLLGIKSYIDPRLIPNRPKYRFIARTIAGDEVLVETYVTEFGVRHGVRSVESMLRISIHDIKDWREI